MSQLQRNNTYDWYLERPRHWCSVSQQYGGGDNLISLLREGWRLTNEKVMTETFGLSGSCPVTVYHIKLQRDSKQRLLKVIENPFIRRFLKTQKLQVKTPAEAATI